jgi:flagellar basal-body rod modification protein FlgD
MPTIDPTSPYQQTTDVRNTSGELGKDDFLKIFAAQLANQDPTDPSAPDYMQTMSQFSMLEQLTNLAAAQEESVHATNAALVGKTVTYLNGDGTTVTGTVQSVAFDRTDDNKGDTVTVDGVAGVPVKSLTSIR